MSRPSTATAHSRASRSRQVSDLTPTVAKTNIGRKRRHDQDEMDGRESDEGDEDVMERKQSDSSSRTSKQQKKSPISVPTPSVNHSEMKSNVKEEPPSKKSKTKVPESDSDVEMTDAPPLTTTPTTKTTGASKSIRREVDEEEMEERKSFDPEPPASESEDESDYDMSDEPADRGDFYQPALAAREEKTDPSDPYGCVRSRMDRILYQLSPHCLPTEMPGLESQYHSIHELLVRTMDESVNNAGLVLGMRGSGKTTLVNLCLHQLKEERRKIGKSFVEVRLNGHIQSDDTLAMREIVYQLCRDHEIEQLKESMDFHSHLAFLLDILNQGKFHETPIVFILDEFHLFTQRTKQTLLYNLCDLLQSATAQICIIGISPDLNCYEMLEKRIRSRLTHRRILMGPQQTQLIGSTGQATNATVKLQDLATRYAELKSILTMKLELPTPSTDSKSKSKPESKVPSKPSSSSSSSSYVLAHNAAIARLLSPKDSSKLYSRFSSALTRFRQVTFFQQVFKLAICQSMGPRHTQLTEQDVLWAMDYVDKDWMVTALNNCTVLELTLLAAMLQLTRRHIHHQNFDLIYSEYHKFQSRGNVGGTTIPHFAESVAFKAFEDLLSHQHLVIWSESAPQNSSIGVQDLTYTGRMIQRRFLPVRFMLSQEEFQATIKKRLITVPTWLMHWANNRSD